jgi:transcription termination factor Rho
MKKDAIYLIKLLDKTPKEVWTESLRAMFISDGFQEKPDNPQSCIVSFALNQAKRRLEHTRAIGKKHSALKS